MKSEDITKKNKMVQNLNENRDSSLQSKCFLSRITQIKC